MCVSKIWRGVKLVLLVFRCWFEEGAGLGTEVAGEAAARYD